MYSLGSKIAESRSPGGRDDADTGTAPEDDVGGGICEGLGGSLSRSRVLSVISSFYLKGAVKKRVNVTSTEFVSKVFFLLSKRVFFFSSLRIVLRTSPAKQ
jgi:hypothetical protein